MTSLLPPIAADYVTSINDHDPAAFHALFAEDAVVNDNGREFRSLAAIKEWSSREIFDADVTLEVLDVLDEDNQVTVRTKVDGNFDRTGLPNPVIIDHRLKVQGGKIADLTCRLAGEKPLA